MKTERIVALEGIFFRNASTDWLFEPEVEIQEPHPYRGVAILLGVVLATWSVAIGAGYCAYRALEILA